MSEKQYLTWGDIGVAASDLVSSLLAFISTGAGKNKAIRVWGVPRGGIPAAMAVVRELAIQGRAAQMVTHPKDADLIIDDIIDSGATMARVRALSPEIARIPFLALYDHRTTPVSEKHWLVFPWEAGDPSRTGDADESATDIFTRLLQYIGEDVNREGLAETPLRAAKAWREWTRGYTMNPEDVLKVFEDGATGYDEMVLVRDIPVYSKCEHHMADIFGTASIAYIPNGKIVGLSKLNRLVDIYASRLQVQERLTTDIADAIEKHLQPKGVGVLLRCRHMCMESRGVRQHGHSTVTSALRGALRDDPAARAEFLQLTK
jgi:GTP cyclohydrolase I